MCILKWDIQQLPPVDILPRRAQLKSFPAYFQWGPLRNVMLNNKLSLNISASPDAKMINIRLEMTSQ
jgi:hypothetical protein